jgi:hypothetical protein
MPTDPDDDAAALPAGVEAQTRRVMDNLAIVLFDKSKVTDKTMKGAAWVQTSL